MFQFVLNLTRQSSPRHEHTNPLTTHSKYHKMMMYSTCHYLSILGPTKIVPIKSYLINKNKSAKPHSQSYHFCQRSLYSHILWNNPLFSTPKTKEFRTNLEFEGVIRSTIISIIVVGKFRD